MEAIGVGNDGGEGRGGFGKFFFLLVLVGVGVAWLTLSNHLKDLRPETGLTREQHWARVEEHLRSGRPDSANERLYISSCPLAIRSKNSGSFGRPCAHFKVASCKQGMCDVGLVSMEEHIVITVIPRYEREFLADAQRDKCFPIEIKTFLNIIGGGPLMLE